MNSSPPFRAGQRCVSIAEPELGLGKILSVDRRFVEVAFQGSDCTRKYAAATAPLRRVVFSIGDSIKDFNGKQFQISDIDATDPNGVVTYICGTLRVSEDLIAQASDSRTPLKRLLSGATDRSEDFSLRANLLALQSQILRSPARGFVGGRIELLPHQLFIAGEVASRRIVRVLLADETGLGKTIEACLILHRLIVTGRVTRCLICVPESLVHQWFIELLRRFNLGFRLFTQEYFDSLAEGADPFLAEPLGLCGITTLCADAARSDMAAKAGWDMVIVDEAHHLRGETKEFACVKKLSEASTGLILLTATPEQLGRHDHFLRLQLLDPKRYVDFSAYEAETDKFLELSRFVGSAIASRPDAAQEGAHELMVEAPPGLLPAEANGGAAPPRAMSVIQLIDRFGTGRVMFRNTRLVVSGFPKRMVHCAALFGESGASKDDPRISWLAQLVKSEPSEKFLVLCTTKELAVSLQRDILLHVKVDAGLFHEDLTLIQRDRNAAWFAEEDGARVLMCSEIGSEGRNFQFCRNLVLFDLPTDPEVLEQRIGRIDRIGQGPLIHIHVPFICGGPQEILCRWYHEGLDAFQKNEPAAGRVGELLHDRLAKLLAERSPDIAQVNAFIEETATLRAELSLRLSSGRDRLLELSSFRPKEAHRLLEEIARTDREELAAKVMGPLFKHYGVGVEEADNDKWKLTTDCVSDHRFPLPKQENPLITFSRKTALAREDIEFVSGDHPMVLNSLDLFLSSECGAGAFALWPDKNNKALFLECIYVLECIAPDGLYVNRFLPPTPLRIIIDHAKKEVTQSHPPHLFDAALITGKPDMLLSKKKITGELLPLMLATAEASANNASGPLIEQALNTMRELLNGELARLTDLRQINSAVSIEEIHECEREKEALEKHLKEARVRLDAVRVVWRG